MLPGDMEEDNAPREENLHGWWDAVDHRPTMVD